MLRATAYRCSGCSDALAFDDQEHTLRCETCGREFSMDMHPA